MTGGQQHVQAGAVGLLNALAFVAGFLDFVGDTAGKVAVAFFVAVVSGFGYQVGRLGWRKLGGRTE